ncbi:MAG: HU family DNA-binding protein [Verrucomicrobia bacterium]|nr:HU family DNA-binding protein [Verrucomicrobiota bacterium]MBV9659054.1 HU family DNA-binding protein [Verrucomicrobiota bacterium]
MNKAELIEAVHKLTGKETSRAAAKRSVDRVVEALKLGLRRDKSVQIVDFGTFKVIERKARLGVNPKTGERIKIRKSRAVKFLAGKDLKSKI